ncbi:unnamed protein product, partial [Polarella glacialis]
MGKKSKPQRPSGDDAVAAESAAAEAEKLLARGEELLDEDASAALSALSEAVLKLPTRQQAWYHRGVAAAELWEDSDEPDTKAQLLETSMASFRQVLRLDTSRRGELRYLAAIASGRLLGQAAAGIERRAEEEDDRGGLPFLVPGTWPALAQPLLVEASQNFEEAARLVREWGHPELGSDVLGAWGEVLALQMRRTAAEAELAAGSTSAPWAWADSKLLAATWGLCEAAADKFSSSAQGETSESEVDDLRWMTLHVEHLLSFVELARRALVTAPTGTYVSEDWASKATAAWRAAVRLATASALLAETSCWEAEALRGDALAAGCELLGAAGVSRLRVPTVQAIQVETTSELSAVSNACGEEEADKERLAFLAEEAYGKALRRSGGAEARRTVGLALGELFLGMARGCKAQGPGDLAVEMYLQRANSAFEAVATLCAEAPADGDSADAEATAWYNIACAAGLAARPDQASTALRNCF